MKDEIKPFEVKSFRKGLLEAARCVDLGGTCGLCVDFSGCRRCVVYEIVKTNKERRDEEDLMCSQVWKVMNRDEHTLAIIFLALAPKSIIKYADDK
jgi:hypothetical protein